MRIAKYYCPNCHKTARRIDATYNEYTGRSNCRWCGSELMYTEDIMEQMICDYGNYLHLEKEKKKDGVRH